MNRIRYRDEFEMLCSRCRDWWPVTLEFWQPVHGTQRCRACLSDIRRAAARAAYRANPQPKRAQSAAKRASERRRKQLERMDPERRPALLERQRAAQKRWYDADPERARERRRQGYANALGRPVREGFGRPRIAA